MVSDYPADFYVLHMFNVFTVRRVIEDVIKNHC